MACATAKASSADTAGGKSIASAVPLGAVSVPTTFVSPVSTPQDHRDWTSPAISSTALRLSAADTVACSRRISWQGDLLSTSWRGSAAESAAVSSPFSQNAAAAVPAATESSRSSTYNTSSGSQDFTADPLQCDRYTRSGIAAVPAGSSTSSFSPILLQSARPGLTFTSPFAESSHSAYLASQPQRVPASPGSPRSPDAISDLPLDSPTTPGASVCGLLSPFSPASIATSVSSVDSLSPLTPLNYDLTSKHLTPFEAAFSKQQQNQQPVLRYKGTVPLRLGDSAYCPSLSHAAGQQDRGESPLLQSPLSPRSKLSSPAQSNMHRRSSQWAGFLPSPSSPMDASRPLSPRTRPQQLAMDAEASASSKRDRRRSVDVGMLVNAREQGKSQAAQAATAAFALNDQRRDERIRKSHNTSGKDSL